MKLGREMRVLQPWKARFSFQLRSSDEGQRRLAGFTLWRYADRVAATHRGVRSTIQFHFDH